MRVVAAAECMIAIDSSRPTSTTGNFINPLLHCFAHDGYPGQVILVLNRNFFTARLGNVFRAVPIGLVEENNHAVHFVRIMNLTGGVGLDLKSGGTAFQRRRA